MARAAKANWYPTDDGGRRYWDGTEWTGQFFPRDLAPGTPKGWHPDSPGVHRWWTGERWTEARVSDSGTIDVVAGIGQKLFTVSTQGPLSADIETALLKALRHYPPARIVQLQVYFSTFGIPHTSCAALVEWERQALHSATT